MLRSLEELLGYKLWARDEHLGEVEDFFFNEEDWQLHYMVADINECLAKDKQTLIALTWISDIDVTRDEIVIDLKQETVRFSPPFDPEMTLNREYEEVLYDYHGKPKYWQAME